MNRIAKTAKLCKTVQLGIGNTIGKNVRIESNVKIGNNNRIEDNTIVYPNVSIGDNNVFLEGNKIGIHPISTDEYNGKIYFGVDIGNNNFFHTENKIFGGKIMKTKIGNYNKILHNVHVGHDVTTGDHVHIYANAIIAGHCTLLSYSGVGMAGGIHQRLIIGGYSFTGMLSACTKDTFPFYIYINNKPTRLNIKRSPEFIHEYKNIIEELCKTYKEMTEYELYTQIKELPQELKYPLHEYFRESKLLSKNYLE
jgi:acyl-[acyl carrier protein]--UDP-N-acetylglucosamine O-acyltransferase